MGLGTARLLLAHPPTLQLHPGGSLPATLLADREERCGEKPVSCPSLAPAPPSLPLLVAFSPLTLIQLLIICSFIHSQSLRNKKRFIIWKLLR